MTNNTFNLNVTLDNFSNSNDTNLGTNEISAPKSLLAYIISSDMFYDFVVSLKHIANAAWDYGVDISLLAFNSKYSDSQENLSSIVNHTANKFHILGDKYINQTIDVFIKNFDNYVDPSKQLFIYKYEDDITGENTMIILND